MRNYKKEYKNYHSKLDQKKKRASRNTARAKMLKVGKVTKGDKKDVTHKNGNPKSNRRSNDTNFSDNSEEVAQQLEALDVENSSKN